MINSKTHVFVQDSLRFLTNRESINHFYQGIFVKKSNLVYGY